VGLTPRNPRLDVENLLVGYLPPDGQDRLLRDVTAASANATGSPPITSPPEPNLLEGGRGFVDRWRQSGWTSTCELIYQGEYRHVPVYLRPGWQTSNAMSPMCSPPSG